MKLVESNHAFVDKEPVHLILSRLIIIFLYAKFTTSVEHYILKLKYDGKCCYGLSQSMRKILNMSLVVKLVCAHCKIRFKCKIGL